jgi:serine/threonine protein kinase
MADNDNTPALIQDIASQIPSEFAVIEFLGEGGHGIVLKALHKTLQQNVALKIIKADRSDETNKRIARMQNEAKILAKFQHKNIVRILQYGACLDGTPFLVCEYLNGITLAQLLKNTPQLSPRLIIEIFPQILDALSCAHENGLLHRDIKPSNIMLVKDEETDQFNVKLLDFGIARDFETVDSAPLGLTRTIQISGSAPYMSPEQCRGERIDQKSDLYSVACMLYECLSGRPPFTGETPMHTRYLQINEAAKIPTDDKFAQTSGRAAVYKLVMDGLSKEPQQRPQSAVEFKNRLHDALPNASSRLFWSPKTKIRARNFGAILLLFLSICALALIASWTIENKNTAKKDDNTPRTAKIASISREVKLKDLAWRFMTYRFDGTAENTKTGLALREDLIAFRKSLHSAKIEQAMNYTALRAQASLEKDMNFYKESKDSWNELLNYCRTATGQISSEAIECYWKLASIAFIESDYGTAENLARKGIAIQNSAGPNGPTPIDIPSFYEIRAQNCTAECYSILADIAKVHGRYDSEFTLREAAETARLEKQRIDINPKYYIALLDAAQKVKGRKEAYKLAQSRYQELCKQSEEGPEEGELANSFSELGHWYFNNNYNQDTARCYSIAKRIFSIIEPEDQQGEKEVFEKRLAELKASNKSAK